MIASRSKVILFLIFLSLFFLIAGQQIWGRPGLLIGLLLAVLLNSTLFFLGENQMLRKMKARPLKGNDPWGLNERVQDMARRLKTPPPQIYLMESQSPTAFSFGLDQSKPCLCVSSDLLQRLNSKEVDVVLAHQLCQLSRHDSFAFAVFSILAHSLVSLTELMDSFLPTQLFTKKPHRFFQYLASPLAWLLLKFAVQRRMFYETDARAGAFLKDRNLLGDVLWQLDTLSRTRPLLIPAFSSHMFIVNPAGEQKRRFRGIFHPSVKRRLTALIGRPIA